MATIFDRLMQCTACNWIGQFRLAADKVRCPMCQGDLFYRRDVMHRIREEREPCVFCGKPHFFNGICE